MAQVIAVMQVQPLAHQLLHAMGAGKKERKKERERERKKERKEDQKMGGAFGLKNEYSWAGKMAWKKFAWGSWQWK